VHLCKYACAEDHNGMRAHTCMHPCQKLAPHMPLIPNTAWPLIPSLAIDSNRCLGIGSKRYLASNSYPCSGWPGPVSLGTNCRCCLAAGPCTLLPRPAPPCPPRALLSRRHPSYPHQRPAPFCSLGHLSLTRSLHPSAHQKPAPNSLARYQQPSA